jgi:hypothetical protein
VHNWYHVGIWNAYLTTENHFGFTKDTSFTYAEETISGIEKQENMLIAN